MGDPLPKLATGTPASWLDEYLQSAYVPEFAARVTAITQTADTGEVRRPER
jgi:hypothetical protein